MKDEKEGGSQENTRIRTEEEGREEKKGAREEEGKERARNGNAE